MVLLLPVRVGRAATESRSRSQPVRNADASPTDGNGTAAGHPALPPRVTTQVEMVPGKRMDRDMMRDHLAQARRHVAHGEQLVARQREIVAQLERDGHDSSEAKRLLDQFEQFRTLQVADRDRLEKELDEASN